MSPVDEAFMRRALELAARASAAGEVPVTSANGLIKIVRLPEDVFAHAAIASFEGKPITLDHPSARRLDIGFDQDFLGYLLARAHFQFFGRMSEMMVRRDLGDVHLYILFGLSVKETGEKAHAA